jgi:hypothetical protein
MYPLTRSSAIAILLNEKRQQAKPTAVSYHGALLVARWDGLHLRLLSLAVYGDRFGCQSWSGPGCRFGGGQGWLSGRADDHDVRLATQAKETWQRVCGPYRLCLVGVTMSLEGKGRSIERARFDRHLPADVLAARLE